MKNLYPCVSPILFLVLILMYAPARATEACRPPNSSTLVAPENPARMYSVGPATTAELTSRKLRFRERLLLRLLKKKGLKSHVSLETETKNIPGEKEKGADMNTASFALGLIAAVILILSVSSGSPILVLLGLAAAIPGLVLGIVGVNKKYPKWWMGIVGMVLAGAGLIGLLVVIWNFLLSYE